MPLTVEDLHKEDLIREFEVQESYEKILDNCQDEIQYTHRYNRKDKMLFTVPRGVPDEPEYDFVACAVYIIKALRTSGFYVRFVRPAFVYVSWANPRQAQRKMNDLKTLIKEDYLTHKAFGVAPKQKSIKSTNEKPMKLLKYKSTKKC